MKTLHYKKIGDFYEFYNDEAKIVSEILNLTLISRRINQVVTPMCAIPYHCIFAQTQKLNDNGYEVMCK